jgi:pilus assembly protein FimV
MVGNMKRHRIIANTLGLLTGALLLAPGAASASGPLLSGYGPPGAGAQTILGAALVNGPGNGAGGGSSGGQSSGAATTTAAAGRSGGASSAGLVGGASQSSATRSSARAHRARTGLGSKTAGGGAATGNPRAAGANPTSAQLSGASTVAITESDTSWFSGADLLALVLASAALALVALATIRLTRTTNGHQ